MAKFDDLRSIPSMISIHRALCEEATRQIAYFEKRKQIKPGHFKVHPLCRAVLVMVDKRFTPDNFSSERNSPPWTPRDIDFCLDHQDVILVCTGDDSGLSKPVDFTPLLNKPLGAIKSLRREDDGDVYRYNSSDKAVRVRIGHAVKFLTDLLKEEEAKMPQQERDNMPTLTLVPDELHITTSPIMDEGKGEGLENPFSDAYLRASTECDEWIKQQMRKAEDDGIDNVKLVWEAMIRWKAQNDSKQRWERPYRIEQWPALLSTYFGYPVGKQPDLGNETENVSDGVAHSEDPEDVTNARENNKNGNGKETGGMAQEIVSAVMAHLPKPQEQETVPEPITSENILTHLIFKNIGRPPKPKGNP